MEKTLYHIANAILALREKGYTAKFVEAVEDAGIVVAQNPTALDPIISALIDPLADEKDIITFALGNQSKRGQKTVMGNN